MAGSFQLYVDGELETYERTYAGAFGARATRHLAYAAFPVPTDKVYKCGVVDLEGEWETLRQVTSATGSEGLDELAQKIVSGVIRYCVATGQFLECPDWAVDADAGARLTQLTEELENLRATSQAEKRQLSADLAESRRAQQKLAQDHQAYKAQSEAASRSTAAATERAAANMENQRRALAAANERVDSLTVAHNRAMQELRAKALEAEVGARQSVEDSLRIEDLGAKIILLKRRLEETELKLAVAETKLQGAVVNPVASASNIIPENHPSVSYYRVTNEGGSVVRTKAEATEFVLEKQGTEYILLAVTPCGGYCHLTTSANTGLYLSSSAVPWSFISNRMMAGQITFSPCSRKYLRGFSSEVPGLMVDCPTLEGAAIIDLVRTAGDKIVLACLPSNAPPNARCDTSVWKSILEGCSTRMTAGETAAKVQRWAERLYVNSEAVWDACLTAGIPANDHLDDAFRKLLQTVKEARIRSERLASLERAQHESEASTCKLSDELRARQAQLESLQVTLQNAYSAAAESKAAAEAASRASHERWASVQRMQRVEATAMQEAKSVQEQNTLLRAHLKESQAFLNTMQEELKTSHEREAKAASRAEAQMRAYGLYIRDAMLRVFAHLVSGNTALADQDMAVLMLCEDGKRNDGAAVKALMTDMAPLLAIADGSADPLSSDAGRGPPLSFFAGVQSRLRNLAARLGFR